LPDYQNCGGSVVDQVLRTTSLIRNSIVNSTDTSYVRPPYGEWSPKVASALNNNLLTSLNHVGPINWKIDEEDWDCWKSGIDPRLCADKYLTAIIAEKRGIVLMHDSAADIPLVQRKNLTFRMIRYLVPALKAAGFHFVRVDADPDIMAFSARPLRGALRGANKKWISPQNGGGGRIFVNGVHPGKNERLRIVDLGNCRVALQAAHGFDKLSGEYFSVPNQGIGPVTATANSAGEWETFDVIMLNDEIALRTFSGTYFSYDASSLELVATSSKMTANQLFTFTSLP
jgi:hypothetical protein